MPRKWFIVVSGTITGPRTEGHPHEEQSIPCQRCQSAGSRGRAAEAEETVRRVAGRVPSTGSAQTLYPVGFPAAITFTSAVVSDLPPIPQLPLLTYSTITKVTERMFSPSMETIASVSLWMISRFLRLREDAFDHFYLNQGHDRLLSEFCPLTSIPRRLGVKRNPCL